MKPKRKQAFAPHAKYKIRPLSYSSYPERFLRRDKVGLLLPPVFEDGRTKAPSHSYRFCPTVCNLPDSGIPHFTCGRVKRGTNTTHLRDRRPDIGTRRRDAIGLRRVIIITGTQPSTRKLSPFSVLYHETETKTSFRRAYSFFVFVARTHPLNSFLTSCTCSAISVICRKLIACFVFAVSA